MDGVGGKEDWQYQNDMMKEQIKALLDQCILLSVDYDPPMGIEVSQEEQALTIRLLPKETS